MFLKTTSKHQSHYKSRKWKKRLEGNYPQYSFWFIYLFVYLLHFSTSSLPNCTSVLQSMFCSYGNTDCGPNTVAKLASLLNFILFGLLFFVLWRVHSHPTRACNVRHRIYFLCAFFFPKTLPDQGSLMDTNWTKDNTHTSHLVRLLVLYLNIENAPHWHWKPRLQWQLDKCFFFSPIFFQFMCPFQNNEKKNNYLQFLFCSLESIEWLIVAPWTRPTLDTNQ